jgi:hypothetical protein
MTQNIEGMEQVEFAIKIIEKVSTYNAFSLLELDTLTSVLNILEFLDFEKKPAYFSILNMIASATTYEAYSKYIENSLPMLTYLAKINDTNNINEIYVVSKIVLAFYYISNNMITGRWYEKNEKNTVKNLVAYGLLDNFIELLMLNENKFIERGLEICRYILRTFIGLASIESEVKDMLMHKGILDILLKFLKSSEKNINNDLNNVNNNNNNKIVSHKGKILNFINKYLIILFYFY